MELMSWKNALSEVCTPLSSLAGAGNLLEDLSRKKIVMLGESSHGTQEFYEWRRQISLELIRHHGFSFIAVEGDWPSCQGVDSFIKGKDGINAITAMKGFSRWPTWMWANSLIMEFMDELRLHNHEKERPVGFHGLDVYSLFDSLHEVVSKLEEHDPILAALARELYSCFTPYHDDERAYLHSLYRVPEGCSEEVSLALTSILNGNLSGRENILDIQQNARIIRNAERYYRAMISQADDSWNVRDEHMLETLDTLLDYYGSDSKAIVWAHNTHIGDHRATDMVTRGHVNIGGLAREKYGEEEVALIGFSTFEGKVIASKGWDGPIEVMNVPEAREGSLERVLHEISQELKHDTLLLDFRGQDINSFLNSAIGHRAIGVVYHPEQERWGNYVPTLPAKRYDAMIFCDKTTALEPLNVKFLSNRIPETFPYRRDVDQTGGN